MSAWGIAPGNRLALDKALKARVSSAQSSNEPAPKNEWRFQRYFVFGVDESWDVCPGFK
jgi:hypothetical protein